LSELRDWALLYAKWGLRVIPLHTIEDGACTCLMGKDCEHKGKHPRIKQWEQLASSDELQIAKWWRQWPKSNIGLMTGEGGRLFVLDVDDRNGGGDSLFALEQTIGKLDCSLIVTTGSGGRHYYYRHPGFYVRGSKNGSGGLEGYPGLDLQGEGNLVVAPPSLHASGNRYEWDAAASPTEGDTFKPAPEALLQLIKPAEAKKRGGSRRRNAEPPFELPSLIAEGGRNETLFKYASSLRARGLDPDEIMLLVAKANVERCSPQLDGRDVETIVKSAARYEQGSAPEAAQRPARAQETANAKQGEALENSAGEPPRREAAQAEEDPEPAHFELTDLGNAKRLVHLFGRDLKWCDEMGCWFRWDGQRWKRDRHGGASAIHFAEETIRDIARQGADTDDADDRKRVFKWMYESQARPRIEAMVALAKKLPGIPVTPDDLDADDGLFGVANGTIVLATGELRDAKREDLITKQGGVPYDPAAKCERFEKWLAAALGSDADQVDFLWRSFGYMLTGYTKEEAFFMLEGPGGSGKGTLLAMLAEILGDYARVMRWETIRANKIDQIPADLADLRGSRMAYVDETGEGDWFNEGTLKAMTDSKARLKVRFLKENFFDMKPKFKVVIATNHKPRVRSFGSEIQRRIKLIEMHQGVELGKIDPNFKGQMIEEQAAGVFAAAVRSCVRWHAEGLGTTAKINDAVELYRSESDPVGRFIDECCEYDPYSEEKQRARPLYEAYRKWCKETGSYDFGEVVFGIRIKAKGVEWNRDKKGNYYVGLTLNDEQQKLEGEDPRYAS
jgi:putative DNA primase/helicase